MRALIYRSRTASDFITRSRNSRAELDDVQWGEGPRGALPLPLRRSHSSDRNCVARTTSPRSCDRDIELVAAAAAAAIAGGGLAGSVASFASESLDRHLPASRRAACSNSEFSCSSPIAAWRVCLWRVNLTARRTWGVRHRASCLACIHNATFLLSLPSN